jgi:hypothetical protein
MKCLAKRLIAFCLLAFACTTVAHAKSGGPAWEDPEKARKEDPDFSIQGEYSGIIAGEEGPLKTGTQVIALGGGQFRAVTYFGGLPGDGWDKSEKMEMEAKAEAGVVVFSKDGYSGTLADGVITVKNPDGKVIGKLEKVERKSPTLGAKPPEGAVVLFDGTSVDNFEKGARMTDDGLLMQGVESNDKFESHKLHLEFRLPYQPTARGQGRGNSGLYVQGRYEVQMLDSFGLKGLSNECGGIYKVSGPSVNMCFPPLSWQTYDVDLTAPKVDDRGKVIAPARVTVKHNGVVIHDDVELPQPTPGGRGGGVIDPGPVFLQDHGNPVRYRNIWVVPK